MTGFSADWLALREPHDVRARNKAVLEAMVAAFAGRSSLAIVDLACGTGATLRAISPFLPPQQSWRLVDNDLGLLARAKDRAGAPGLAVAAMPVDLVRDLEIALDGPYDLVAMSAFLDLVSAPWLERLATEAAVRGLPVYAALTYDGRIAMEPEDPLDQRVIAAFNRHQHGDKGFGPALGPAAAGAAVTILERVGYVVQTGTADWKIGHGDRRDDDIQRELLSGYASAARETGDIALADLLAWLTRRRAAIAEGRASLMVGHIDLFARPTGTRWGDRSQSNSTSSPIA